MDTPQAPMSTPPDQGKLMAILSYIGPLVIVSYLVAKDNPVAKFHIKQGAVLFVIEVAVWIVSKFFLFLYFLYPLWLVLNLALLVLSIVGIMNVVQGKEKELPLVGKYSSHIPI